MNPALIIAAVDAGLALLEKFWPELEKAVSKGEISVDEQTARAQRVKELRPGGSGFTGPEWAVQPPTTPGA